MEEVKELTVREKQELILEIMKDVDRFCRAHDIPYTLSSGTLLGAVRHKGFIPWDDDADMFMLREDFDRFVQIYRSDRYHLESSILTGKGSPAMGFAKICDPSTMISSARYSGEYGLFLDIFPLDHVPEEPTACRKRMHSLMRIYNRIYHRQRKDVVSILKSYHHSLGWWCRRLERAVHDNAYSDSPLVAHAIGTTNYRTVIHKERFRTLKDISFEGYDFLGFSNPGSYLSKVYGEDYMTPRQWSHDFKAYQKKDPNKDEQ